MNPQNKATLSRNSLIFGILVMLVASAVPVMASLHQKHPIDDAYITFSYARSLSEGHGFVFGYTADKPVLGTTTPLFAILLAILSKVIPFVEIPVLAVAVSTLTWIATGWLWALQGTWFGFNWLESFRIGILILVAASL